MRAPKGILYFSTARNKLWVAAGCLFATWLSRQMGLSSEDGTRSLGCGLLESAMKEQDSHRSGNMPKTAEWLGGPVR